MNKYFYFMFNYNSAEKQKICNRKWKLWSCVLFLENILRTKLKMSPADGFINYIYQ